MGKSQLLGVVVYEGTQTGRWLSCAKQREAGSGCEAGTVSEYGCVLCPAVGWRCSPVRWLLAQSRYPAPSELKLLLPEQIMLASGFLLLFGDTKGTSPCT